MKRLLAAAIFLAVPAVAHAHDGGGGKLPPDPAPVAEEGKRAKTILDRVASDTESLPAVKPLVDAGRKSLARAYAAHLASDAIAAQHLSKVALAQASAAEAALGSAKAEAKAKAIQDRVAALRAKTKELRAAVTELETERAQLRLEIDKRREAEKTRRATDTKKELDDAGKRKAKPKSDKKEKKK